MGDLTVNGLKWLLENEKSNAKIQVLLPNGDGNYDILEPLIFKDKEGNIIFANMDSVFNDKGKELTCIWE